MIKNTELMSYEARNDRNSCVCGFDRTDIPRNMWRVTEKETDLIFPSYYYRCPNCASFSAVNLYFPVDKYESMSLDYIHIDATKLELNSARAGWIARRSALPENCTVFDLGAGEGCFSHVFSILKPQSTIFAVEADGRLEGKFYATNSRVKFVRMYIEEFLASLSPASGSKADLVIMTDVLEHVLAPEKLLKAVADAIVPGGYAYLTIPDANTFCAPFPYAVKEGDIFWPQANRTCQHLWTLQPETFRRLVSDYFDIVAESQEFETNIRRDSVYSTLLARRYE